MKKTLWVSPYAPPMGSGSPIIMYRHLAQFPKKELFILTSEKRNFSGRLPGKWLDATYYFLNPVIVRSISTRLTPKKDIRWVFSKIMYRVLLYSKVIEIRDIFKRVYQIRDQILDIVHKQGIDILLSTSDDGAFMIAAYLAARKSRVKYYVFLLDLYANNELSFTRKILAWYYESKILKSADKIFVTNINTQNHYKKLYGVDTQIVPHPVDMNQETKARPAAPRPTIVYGGSIYWAQLDAVRNLVKALEFLPQVTLKIYSNNNTTIQLDKMGISGKQVQLESVKEEQMSGLLRSADILFLPLSFGKKGINIIKTASPGKMIDYFVSGVPILVHAPKYSYISEYARSNQWGLVVDNKDPKLLAEEIKVLISDNERRSRLVQQAYEVAQKYHNPKIISSEFMSYFK